MFQHVAPVFLSVYDEHPVVWLYHIWFIYSSSGGLLPQFAVRNGTATSVGVHVCVKLFSFLWGVWRARSGMLGHMVTLEPSEELLDSSSTSV